MIVPYGRRAVQYLVSLCVRRDFGGVVGVGAGRFYGPFVEAECATVDGDGGFGESVVCGCDSACCFLFFALCSSLFAPRIPQSAIRNPRFLYLPSGSSHFALNDSAIRMRN